MLNLDNSRENAGRFEVELYVRLMEDRACYAGLYRRILRAARHAGLGEFTVPDFLGLLADDDALLLLGQDELGPEEIEVALREGSAEARRLGKRTGAVPRVTERLIEQRARLGQHRFARQVLADYDHRCGFCGFSPGAIPKSRLLFASHIKPWRDSNPRERLDPRNGIAACPTHDAAFDGGLLTVNGGLRVHRADSLDALVVSEPEADRYFGEGALRPWLVVPTGAPGPARRYLEYHRTKVFRAG
jgi:putative restriction endonuclease